MAAEVKPLFHPAALRAGLVSFALSPEALAARPKLTPDEVKLMWDTAPPRMPIALPAGK